MRKKYVFLCIIITLILSGFSAANGKTLGVPFETIKINDRVFFQYQTKSNFLLDADVDRIRTLIEKLGESLNARVMLNESTKEVYLIKPNVQMITAAAIGIDKDNKLVFDGVFGKSKKGTKLEKFKVYTEVQEIPSGKVDFRLQIETPTQEKIAVDAFVVSPEIASTDKSDATIIYDVTNAHFTETGAYKLKLQMRMEGEETFYTIAEKTIEVASSK